MNGEERVEMFHLLPFSNLINFNKILEKKLNKQTV